MSNKAIISLLVCLCGIIFSTLLLLKKDVRKNNVVNKNQLPYEVQSASAQSFLLSGKYEFANKIFENSYNHYRDNPAFVERYALSLNRSKKQTQALSILEPATLEFPLHKGLRLEKAKALILNNQNSRAYNFLTSIPLFNHKDPNFLSLIILTTPNSQALESLMIKMKSFHNYQKYFSTDLINKSANQKILKRHLANNG